MPSSPAIVTRRESVEGMASGRTYCFISRRVLICTPATFCLLMHFFAHCTSARAGQPVSSTEGRDVVVIHVYQRKYYMHDTCVIHA